MNHYPFWQYDDEKIKRKRDNRYESAVRLLEREVFYETTHLTMKILLRWLCKDLRLYVLQFLTRKDFLGDIWTTDIVEVPIQHKAKRVRFRYDEDSDDEAPYNEWAL